MRRIIRTDQKGFTMVEAVIASMLVGMVLLAAFPMIMTGRNVVSREQREMEARLLGDSVFERIYGELQAVGPAEFDDEELLETVFGSTKMDARNGKSDLEERGFDIEVEAESLEREWVLLGVRLMEEGTVRYEREEVVPILNLGLQAEMEEVKR